MYNIHNEGGDGEANESGMGDAIGLAMQAGAAQNTPNYSLLCKAELKTVSVSPIQIAKQASAGEGAAQQQVRRPASCCVCCIKTGNVNFNSCSCSR